MICETWKTQILHRLVNFAPAIKEILEYVLIEIKKNPGFLDKALFKKKLNPVKILYLIIYIEYLSLLSIIMYLVFN